MATLTTDLIPFGKYKGLTLTELLKDRKYCRWLLDQDWFNEKYSQLAHRINTYNPLDYFLHTNTMQYYSTSSQEFVASYPWFKLAAPSQIKHLTDRELQAYRYYYQLIMQFRDTILKTDSCNIKAPKKWLQKFENETGISRNTLKKVLASNDLPNVTKILEDIKKVAGINYKGHKSYKIAKDKSLEQEQFWAETLRHMYGHELGTQFQYEHCIFDFIHIESKTLYECKLGYKDLSIEQFNKYVNTLKNYRLIYLIGYDCIIDISNQKVHTTDPIKYSRALAKYATQNSLTEAITEFEIVTIKNIGDFFSQSL